MDLQPFSAAPMGTDEKEQLKDSSIRRPKAETAENHDDGGEWRTLEQTVRGSPRIWRVPQRFEDFVSAAIENPVTGIKYMECSDEQRWQRAMINEEKSIQDLNNGRQTDAFVPSRA